MSEVKTNKQTNKQKTKLRKTKREKKNIQIQNKFCALKRSRSLACFFFTKKKMHPVYIDIDQIKTDDDQLNEQHH